MNLFRQDCTSKIYFINTTNWNIFLWITFLLVHWSQIIKTFYSIYIPRKEKKIKMFRCWFFLLFCIRFFSPVIFWYLFLPYSIFPSLDNSLYLFLACFHDFSLLFIWYSFVRFNSFFLFCWYFYWEKDFIIIHVFPLSQNFSLCLLHHLCSYTKNGIFDHFLQ